MLYVPELKDFMDKARKIHQRLYQIQEFEMPGGANGNNLNETADLMAKVGGDIIKQSEILDIINALKMQHEFINETETTYQLFMQVKSRAEAFFQYEFCKSECDDPAQEQKKKS